MDESRDDSSRSDIRRLLKTFGVKADEAIIQYLTRHPEGPPLHVHIVLEQIPSGSGVDEELLKFSVEGQIRR